MPRWLSSKKVEVVRQLLAEVCARKVDPRSATAWAAADAVPLCSAGPGHAAAREPWHFGRRLREGGNGTCPGPCRAFHPRLLCRPSTARPSRRLRSARGLPSGTTSDSRPGIRSTSSWPSTRAAAARVPFQSRRSVRLPTDIYTCALQPSRHWQSQRLSGK